MKYEIAHLFQKHDIISDLWIRVQNLLDNENNVDDLIEKIEILIEEFNDIESGSFMNNPTYFDFTLSWAYDEIRISESKTTADLIVIKLLP